MRYEARGIAVKNLAQIRAQNALAACRIPQMGLGQNGGNALSGFPMIIKAAGLLAAGAYAVETKANGNGPKQQGAQLILDHIAKHLHTLKICNAESAMDLVEELAGGDATKLRRATAEALAYLNYLKRFVS